jgi:RimJ/RimL family protein N-acetyltransferase
MERHPPARTVAPVATRAVIERRRAVLTLAQLLALDSRLSVATFVIVPGEPSDVPAIAELLRTRLMPSGLPLKFPRTEALLAARWPEVSWLLAKRDGRIIGCLELRPMADEPGTWEMGSFSQAVDNLNPRVPVKLMTAGFHRLVELGVREAIVEVHRRNEAMWRFLAHLPFEPECQSPEFPDFVRCRMRLDGPR